MFSHGDKTVTITMKGWKFADGQTVNAQSLMFFLNMYKADPKSFCGYNPGYGIPDQVSNAFAQGNSVVIDFKTSVNPGWILYNYLVRADPDARHVGPDLGHATSTCASGLYGTRIDATRLQGGRGYLDARRPRRAPTPTPCGRAVTTARGA